MNPETALTNKIRAAIKRRSRSYVVRKIHGGPMGHAGMADLWCSIHGMLVCIEVKVPGNKPDPIQLHERSVMARSGAIAGVAYSVDDAIELVKFAERKARNY
jgi:hypothetical protein